MELDAHHDKMNTAKTSNVFMPKHPDPDVSNYSCIDKVYFNKFLDLKFEWIYSFVQFDATIQANEI